MTSSGLQQEAGRDEELRLKLPGFGLPVEHEPYLDTVRCFLHPLWDSKSFKSCGLSLREIRMMGFVDQITDKPNWEEKVFDEAIIARWRDETKSIQTEDLDQDVFMSDDMFDYCIKELRDKAKKAKRTGVINIFDAEVNAAKSDTAIPSSLADALKAAAKPLEDIPEEDKVWHPGCEIDVLDLLHPSLFPLVYGTTRVLPYGKVPLKGCVSFAGQGETTAPFEAKQTAEPALWGSNQWLPSDIEWTETGPKIVSYINNLYPDDHEDLYRVFEQFVAAAIPLWEECLYTTPALTPRIDCSQCDGMREYGLAEGQKFPCQVIEDTFEEGEKPRTEDELWDWNSEGWLRENGVLRWPEPEDYSPRERAPAFTKPNLKDDFPSGLQVIFKLANMYLDPENPSYEGGNWHVEGALNERIVATALYYYDSENITESRLAFRNSVDCENVRMIPPQHEWHSLKRWMGIQGDDELPVQRIGSVLTRPGRLLAFPNVYQHQVEPFQLQDPTKPGHRKILAMFLVDPNIRVLSTGVVPPQRKDWWERWVNELHSVPRFGRLPIEIFELITGSPQDSLMDWERAHEIMDNVIDERSWTQVSYEQKIHEDNYYFCEH